MGGNVLRSLRYGSFSKDLSHFMLILFPKLILSSKGLFCPQRICFDFKGICFDFKRVLIS
jgi:hypothetical protein